MNEAVALITGAGRGIGRAAAQELASHGYRLALLARTEKDLRETQQQAQESIIIPADVADPIQVGRAVSRCAETFGRLDAIVHCAGSAPTSSRPRRSSGEKSLT